jgi:hypothetical protein
MMRKLFPVALAVSLAAAFAFAQAQKKEVKLTGFVLDNMCASEHGNEAEAKEHETSCALMEHCAKSGYAVVSKDAVYKLDARGNELVHALLKDTKTKKGLAVNVEGALEGDLLHVDKLEEAR